MSQEGKADILIQSQFLGYEAEDGRIKIDVRLSDETVWLTQQLMADLFQTSKQNISHHIQSVFDGNRQKIFDRSPRTINVC